MEEVRLTRQRSIRLLFLGDIETDRRVKNFIRYFNSRGWYTELLCSTRSGQVQEELSAELHGRVHPLKRHDGPLMFYEHHSYLMSQLRTLPSLDVTLACDLYSLPAGRYAKSKGLTQHLSYDAREVYTGLPTVVRKPLARWFWKCVERKGLKATDSIIVTGALDAGAIEKVHNILPRSFLVRNIPLRTQKPERNNYLREHFGIDPKKRILVYVGGIQRDRGLGQMVNAMSALKDEAVFVMIGDGELREGLRSVCKNAGVSSDVYFHDPIPSEQVLSVLASADIGVVLVDTDAPSYALALPSKIYEYLFAGLPVLASPMKQAMKEFGGHEAIRFVKLHDEAAVIRGVRELLPLAHSGDILKWQDEAIHKYAFEYDAAPYVDYLEERTP